MNISSLERKTIRPGSLVNYSYYHSDRHLPQAETQEKKSARPKRTILFSFALLAVVLIPFTISRISSSVSNNAPLSNRAANSAASTVTGVNHCQGNTLSQEIVVSINERKAWACQYGKVAYSTPVVTGITTHQDTSTPTGSYVISGKSTNLTLTGSDSVSSWSDPVSYWMPFLNNQYGTYGFHDATWRPNSAFGNIDPSSSSASHGCVELPLSAAKWLYNWANVGTHVTITS